MSKRAYDRHHILWQARMYNKGYAKRLRTHPWMKVKTPRDTLHKEIHNKLACIPTPPQKLCKRAYLALIELEAHGQLRWGTLEERIDWLLDIWSFEEAPYTVLALRDQKFIVHEFYRKSEPP